MNNTHAILEEMHTESRKSFMWVGVVLAVCLAAVIGISVYIQHGAPSQALAAPEQAMDPLTQIREQEKALDAEAAEADREYQTIQSSYNKITSSAMSSGNDTITISLNTMTPIGDSYTLLVDSISENRIHVKVFLENEFAGDKYIERGQQGYVYETPNVACSINLMSTANDLQSAQLQTLCEAKDPRWSHPRPDPRIGSYE